MASSDARDAPDGPLPTIPTVLTGVLMIKNLVYGLCNEWEIIGFFLFGKPIHKGNMVRDTGWAGIFYPVHPKMKNTNSRGRRPDKRWYG
jgi:hypothetical protein